MITKTDITSTLSALGIEVSEIEALKGERITRFVVKPTKGFKVSQLENLDEDLAFNLEINPSYLRLYKQCGTIFIEVPNEEQRYVSLLPLLDSEEFKSSSDELPIVLGKTFNDEIVTCDLCKIQHLLIAGEMWAGKTECLHTIITSLICSRRNVKLQLLASKKENFDRYNELPKSIFFASESKDSPIIVSFEDAMQTLKTLDEEIERRYDLLRAAGAKSIKEYNNLVDSDEKRLPYIVSIFDEFGEIIIASGNEAEQPLVHIAMLGQAVGIHSIISTARPTYYVITGRIQAFYPTHIAFKTISAIDSSVILQGSTDASKLLEEGDMLFQTNYNNLVRLQCAYIPEDEFASIIKMINNK